MKPIEKNTGYSRRSKSSTPFNPRKTTHLQKFLFSMLMDKLGDNIEVLGRKTLQGYVDNAFEFHGISKDEHLKYREINSYYAEHSKLDMCEPDLPGDIYGSVAELLIFDDESMTTYLKLFSYVSRSIWLSSLKQYSPWDFETEIFNISSYWQELHEADSFKLPEPVTIEGCANLDDPVYFYIEYSNRMMKLVFQPADIYHVYNTICDWIGYPQVFYITEKDTDLSSVEEDVIHFIWFSPDTPVIEQYNILTKQDVWIDEMHTKRVQLKRLINHQINTRANMKEEIIVIDPTVYRE
ncbi:hypothetical protein [Sporosarcina cascadiensis]|uniref:hypothetical protein n=1 Tax=Sporosarcina cascadiensis TaxID=2660747 RepID=UPI00129ACF0F|nr:hypothetical protein [Sporosarcina cascadiensis]